VCEKNWEEGEKKKKKKKKERKKVRVVLRGGEMAGSQETGTSLMDLITADPAPPGNPAFPPLGMNPTPDRTKPTPPRKSTSQPPTTDLLVSIKAPTPTKSSLAPLKQKRKPVSYSQLARALQELASATDQKSSHKLLHQVFPKLAVYSSVDPSLAPSLLKVCVCLALILSRLSSCQINAEYHPVIG
jgi:hypothetical protein